MKKYSHNCSDRKIFTTVYFGIESCTGRGADFQKLFKGSWWWLRYLRSLRPLQDALKSLWSAHPVAGGLCARVVFPLRPEVLHFRLMQMKAAQVLSKLWSKHCSELGIATCAEPAFQGVHTLSEELFTWDMCSSHATVPAWFWLRTQVTSAVCVWVRNCASVGNSPVCH